MLQEQLQSRVIDFLRFPLIIGVVFIHNYASEETVQGIQYGLGGITPPRSFDFVINSNIRNLFSHILADIGVPLFFLISGYLFFYKIAWSKEVYHKKLISRSQTLLIPYLFWNGLALLFSFIVTLPFCKSLYPGAVAKGFQLSFLDCVQGFWVDPRVGVDGFPGPFSFQFWFIRDLMVMVALTPLIRFFLLKLGWKGLILLGLLWFGIEDQTAIPGVSTTAVFFFSAGAYFSLYGFNLVERFGKVFLLSLLLYPCMVIGDLLFIGTSWHLWIHRLDILGGMLFVFNTSAWLIGHGKVRVSAFLAGASFFVFAVHVPVLLPSIRKVLYLLFRPENSRSLLLVYFLAVFFVAGISLLLYKFLRRYLSRFTNVITGGR